MMTIDQLTCQMIVYENEMEGHVSNIEDIESELIAVTSHSSTCQVLRDAYSELEDQAVTECFADPIRNLKVNISRIRGLRRAL